MTFPLNDRRIINGWCFFDWANSAYSLVITATIFPIYYSSVSRTAFGGDQVLFFGIPVENTVLYSYSLSFSFLLIAFLSPILSGIADYSGRKKSFMRFFTMIGSAACITLFFFTGANVELGIIASVIASIGFSGGLVFYNAYLPEIASPDRYDEVSARGFSFGYIGSVLLLIVNLTMVQQPEWFGLPDAGMASRVSFLMVGVWWLGFSQITFSRLPKSRSSQKLSLRVMGKGFQELQKVWEALKEQPDTKKFLLAFFFYSTGVQTIIYLSALFGEKELNMESGKLIATVLLLQIVAIIGAYIFAFISKKKGNKFTLILILAVWICICFGAFFVYTDLTFYLLASAVGVVMGGVQSLSRATYSKLFPENTPDTASYFSFYDVLEKVAIVVGTFAYGMVEQITGSMRNSTLALSLFFITGLIFLSFVTVRAAASKPH